MKHGAKPFSCLFFVLFFSAAAVAQDSGVGDATGKAGAGPEVDSKAEAYYHYTLGHMYREMAAVLQRSEYMQRAIEEYKQALAYDPTSPTITVQLAEAYELGGRRREAVLEAQELLRKDPDNLPAHRLLGRIYFQSLGRRGADSTSRTLGLAIEQYEHIARLAPDEIESLLTLAQLYRFNNQLDEAEATLKKVLETEPQSDEALAELAALYSDRGEHDKTIELLGDAQVDSESGEVLARLGFAYEQSNQFEKAVDAYRRALQKAPKSLDIRRRLAESLLRAERTAEALTEYESLTALDPDDAESWLRLSQIYRHQKQYDKAREALDHAKESEASNPEILFNEALLYEAQGDFSGAIETLTNLLAQFTQPDGSYTPQQERTRGIVLERLGNLHRQNQDYEAAAESFQLMAELGREEERRALAQIAETYRQGRDLDKAVAASRRAVEQFPDDRVYKIQLATLLGDRGELEEAVGLARSLLNETPQDRQVYMALAQIYERSRRYDDALASVNEAEKLADDPSEREGAHFLRGAIYERQKKYAEAEAEFRAALEINPDSAVTLNYLGYMLADNGEKLDEALQLIQRAVEMDPYNGAYLDSLGWAYFQLENVELAERYLLRALERARHDPTIHDHLGDVYYRTGRLHLAQQAWERALTEWGRVPRTEFDTEVHAKLEGKLQQLKLRLAQETPNKPAPERKPEH